MQCTCPHVTPNLYDFYNDRTLHFWVHCPFKSTNRVNCGCSCVCVYFALSILGSCIWQALGIAGEEFSGQSPAGSHVTHKHIHKDVNALLLNDLSSRTFCFSQRSCCPVLRLTYAHTFTLCSKIPQSFTLVTPHMATGASLSLFLFVSHVFVLLYIADICALMDWNACCSWCAESAKMTQFIFIKHRELSADFHLTHTHTHHKTFPHWLANSLDLITAQVNKLFLFI